MKKAFSEVGVNMIGQKHDLEVRRIVLSYKRKFVSPFIISINLMDRILNFEIFMRKNKCSLLPTN